MLVYFPAMWYILWSFGIFCGHLAYFVVIWHILWSFGIFHGYFVYFSRFGVLHYEKSGNPSEHFFPRLLNEPARFEDCVVMTGHGFVTKTYIKLLKTHMYINFSLL
jgi:hypothetical protein